VDLSKFDNAIKEGDRPMHGENAGEGKGEERIVYNNRVVSLGEGLPRLEVTKRLIEICLTVIDP
jgi:hypothetical protein